MTNVTNFPSKVSPQSNAKDLFNENPPENFALVWIDEDGQFMTIYDFGSINDFFVAASLQKWEAEALLRGDISNDA